MVALRTSIISDQLSMDFEEALVRIKNRFAYVEIHALWNKTVEELHDDEAREVEALLQKHNMSVSCLSTTLFLMCPLRTSVQSLEKFSDTFLTFTGNYGEHMDCLKKCIDLSKRFNTEYIRIFPFRLEEGFDGDFYSVYADMRERFGNAAALAEKEKKCLILENCPHSYLPRGNMTFELAQSMNSRSFMLLYDIGNSFSAAHLPCPERFKQMSLIDEYELIKERVAYFHFKDYKKRGRDFQHVIFGEGDVGYEKLYRHIQKDAGNRIVSLEPEVESRDVEKSIQHFIHCSTHDDDSDRVYTSHAGDS
jgi:sugar phosphate isomerase/epimerase